MNFTEKLKDLPENPGVYLMLDNSGEIIYVGKAKNLRNRVRQYFNSAVKTVKVMAMVEHIADFKYIICASEVDALLTENNLIKKHAPRYNILLKDDKSYPFIKIDLKKDFPTIDLVRTLKNDGAKYFGPYMQSVNIRDIFDLIHTAFPVRDCHRDMTKPSRACLNYHLGKCIAPCTGKVTKEEYHAEIDKVISFLHGNDREVERVLKERMKQFSDEENYEVALAYRNKLNLLDKLVRKQVSSLPKDFNLDLFAVESNGIKSGVNMLVVRGGKLVGGDNFVTDCADDNLSSYIFQYYSKNPPVCDEVITDCVGDERVLEEGLSDLTGRKIRVISPRQGVRKQLLELAHTNAADALEKFGTKEERQELRTIGAVRQLADCLNLKKLPYRIEAYDISHISGTDKVASMVVFEGGEPKKEHYRRFRIRTVEGNNDFACMKETLIRRLQRLNDEEEKDESFASAPDLILIDGGKGQLSYALDALALLGRTDLQILSLAKREEEVFLGDDPKQSILIPLDSVALQLLQRVRDEAHRFAITYHRSLRSKHVTETALTKIEGVGKTRAAALMKNFGSLENIRHATLEQLAAAGVPKNVAKAIQEAMVNGDTN